MKTSPRRMQLELLESRDAPALFGGPLAEAYAIRAGLAGSDVHHFVATYTVRSNDPFDVHPNDTFSAATVLTLAKGSTRIAASADIATGSDVDYFKITTPAAPGLTSIAFRVQASGVSLLTPSVTVFDANQRLLGTASTTDPLNNDVLINLTGVRPGTAYYVRVSGSRRDIFGIGSYHLTADFLYRGATPPLATSRSASVPLAQVSNGWSASSISDRIGPLATTTSTGETKPRPTTVTTYTYTGTSTVKPMGTGIQY